MRMTLLAIAVTVSVLWAGDACGRVWHVERDGSGDFTVIQDAVDAASPGDVIEIGPGRYTEWQAMQIGSYLYHIYVYITTADLTLIGAGSEVTVIGPGDGPPNVPDTDGIYAPDVGTLRVEGIGFDQLRLRGIESVDSRVEVRDCRFSGPGGEGITGWFPGGLLVENCRFEGLNEKGLTIFDPTTGAMIRNCRFTDVRVGMQFNYPGSTNCRVESCEFEGGLAGVIFSDAASGAVVDCQFIGQTIYGIFVDTNDVLITGNYVETVAGNAIFLGHNVPIDVSDNIFISGFCCVRVWSGVSLNFHNNHILRQGSGWLVRTIPNYSHPAVHIDMTNNWWGTDSAAEISQWIEDGYDHPDAPIYIDFEPFLGGPVQTESVTWGAVKSLFR